jgi:hypothetical protein
MRGFALLTLGVALVAAPADLTGPEREALHVAQKRLLFAQMAELKARDEVAAAYRHYSDLEAAARKKMGRSADEQLDEKLDWVKPKK